MGALESLLITIIFFDAFIPTTCWIAPEIPNAKYNLGETFWPELPTWWYGSNQPASTIGLDEANSPPIAVARFFAVGRFSSFPIPLPTDTITLACDKSTDCADSWNFSPGVIES